MAAIQSLATFPTRCSRAPENDAFEEEIRHLLNGKRGGVYRILFTIKDDVFSVLFIRHSAQDWIVPTIDASCSVEVRRWNRVKHETRSSGK